MSFVKSPVRRLLWIILTVFTTWAGLSAQHFTDPLPPQELADQLVNAMTNEELLGQVLMFGWDSNLVEPETTEWIDRGLGSIKVFGWNGRDTQVLGQTIAAYQEQALNGPYGIPLFVATDQEGGWVQHVTDQCSETPGNMAIGATGRAADSYQSSYLIGQELRQLGINMNFAPNVDLYLNKATSIVSSRAFTADPREAAWLGLAWYQGQYDSGVIATAKHFPGHGNADKDSHGGLPVINTDLETLQAEDLLPYRMLIHNGLNAIMVGHLAFPTITGEVVPSSRSEFFLTQLLRWQMGFEGIVITDDMIMYGARYGGESMTELCEASLRAGADLLLVSRSALTHEQVWNHLLSLMDEDRVLYNRVKESARRVLRVKLMDLRGERAVPYFPGEPQLPHPEMENFNRTLAARSVTQLRPEAIPFPADEERLLIVSQDSQFRIQGEAYFPEADFFQVPTNPGPGELTAARNRLIASMDSYDRVLISYKNGRDEFILEMLSPWADKITLVLARNPYWIVDVPWCRSALAIYMDSPSTIEMAMAVLRGDIEPRGRLPLSEGDSF